MSTYIVAQSPEVLAQLLKDNQSRGVCPSVYTTPASPFNTLAVQFQHKDQVLTTAVVSDLPFFDPTFSDSATISHDSTQSTDSILSDTNLDSLDSSDTISSLISSLSVSETQSPIANKKHQQKIKEMQNLYPANSKTTVSGVPNDMYATVQKFAKSNPSPVSCSEIYGPVVNFTQSSTIMGNISQSSSITGNFTENCGNLNNVQRQSSNESNPSIGQTSVIHNEQQPMINHQNPSIVQASNIVYSRSPSAPTNVPIPTSGIECLYAPVLKFRAKTSTQSSHEVKPVQNAVSHGYPQNYGQQVYPNVAQQLHYTPRVTQSQIHAPFSPSQQSNGSPVYAARTCAVNVAQSQIVHRPIYHVQKDMGNQQIAINQAHHPLIETSLTNLNVHQGTQAVNIPQFATSVARITTFNSQTQDEKSIVSMEGTLSGSLISSGVSDGTMSSSGSMIEEAQQDQVRSMSASLE